MNSSASEHVTLVEVLKLTKSFEDYAIASQALARRLETEGIKALVTLQFYANPESTELGAILTFADRSQIMQHINMMTAWPEFQQFVTTVKPIDMKVFGKLSAEAEEWVSQFNVLSKKYENHVAGFVR
ncbi:MAG: hypothetical protein RMX68_021870 [Aulosira sp. ZfuVER01]|nr:hypothetical protein [Aulosira sp. ZfuVER01]MDZ8002889.1 hypothetical protein [Aulosira sp. DedVER01a]MDZ8053600.1 hypothetical protein [Aulosira sp. ZfuCHP01]